MKRTLSTTDVAHLLMQDEFAKWSRPAAFALADYYQNLENETGEEMDFDAVAIRCDWTEYETLEQVAEAYSYSSKSTSPGKILAWIERQGFEVIETSESYLIRE